MRPIGAKAGTHETFRLEDPAASVSPTDLALEPIGGGLRFTLVAQRSACAERLGTDRLHGVAGVSTAFAAAVELTGSTISDPGLGASVPTPPTAILVAGWVVGVIALAVLWAASRR